MTIRAFAGLPDGSEWMLDAVPVGSDPEAAGIEVARRMLAAGVADLLSDAEAMAAR